jgi:hypothetical protein
MQNIDFRQPHGAYLHRAEGTCERVDLAPGEFRLLTQRPAAPPGTGTNP